MSERLKKVNSVLKKTLSEVIQKDVEVTSRGKRVFYTVTEVKVTPDLQHAEVYVSVLGNQEESERGFILLQKQVKKIQYLMASQIHLKYTPKIILKLDETQAYASRIEEIIKKIHEND